MKTKKAEIKNKSSTIFSITIILMAVMLAASLCGLAYYDFMYHQAIEQGAKSVVTALELTAVCMNMSNITDEQLTQGYLDMFIKPGMTK